MVSTTLCDPFYSVNLKTSFAIKKNWKIDEKSFKIASPKCSNQVRNLDHYIRVQMQTQNEQRLQETSYFKIIPIDSHFVENEPKVANFGRNFKLKDLQDEGKKYFSSGILLGFG